MVLHILVERHSKSVGSSILSYIFIAARTLVALEDTGCRSRAHAPTRAPVVLTPIVHCFASACARNAITPQTAQTATPFDPIYCTYRFSTERESSLILRLTSQRHVQAAVRCDDEHVLGRDGAVDVRLQRHSASKKRSRSQCQQKEVPHLPRAKETVAEIASDC